MLNARKIVSCLFLEMFKELGLISLLERCSTKRYDKSYLSEELGVLRHQHRSIEIGSLNIGNNDF